MNYNPKEQWSKNSTRDIKENKPEIDIHSNRVRRNKVFKPKIFLSLSSNVRSFLSLQMHHIKQWGIAFQISMFQCQPNPPCQQANKSTTRLGITQWILNKAKITSHNFFAYEQWRRRSTDSPSALNQPYTCNTNSLVRDLTVSSYPQSKFYPKQLSKRRKLP